MITIRNRTIQAAIRRAGCGYDDYEPHGTVAERLYACLVAPGTGGSDGDYSEADRLLFERALDLARQGDL